MAPRHDQREGPHDPGSAGPRRNSGRTALALTVGALALAAPAPAIAAIQVTNHADEVAGGNGCSLREAISAANNNNHGPGGDCTAGAASGTDTIVLPAGGAPPPAHPNRGTRAPKPHG